MTGGRLHTWKTIGKMIQNLRNGYQLVSIPPHGLKSTKLELLTEQKNKFEFLGASISRTRNSIINRSAHSNQGPQIPAVPTK